jgi:hypothetical protein
MYASEEAIWQQFEGAVGAFSLTPEMADEIAEALNATERKAIAANRREAETFDKILRAVDSAEDQAYSDFRTGVLDDEGYRRQVQRLRDERFEVSSQLARANMAITGAAVKTAKDVFELATNANLLWKKQGRLERLALLRKVCSNQVLDGQILRYDLRKPFLILSEMKHLEDWSCKGDSNCDFRRTEGACSVQSAFTKTTADTRNKKACFRRLFCFWWRQSEALVKIVLRFPPGFLQKLTMILAD